MKKVIIGFLLLGLPSFLSAGENHLGGKVYDVTANKDGLLIRLEGNAVPTNCPNPNNWGWMVIPEENKTIISLALAKTMSGNNGATIYTSGTVSGFCKVIQYHPHN